ncbi:MAG: phage tail termination protein [Glaciecola sp.]
MLLIETVKEYLDAANIVNDYRYLIDFDESQYKSEFVFVMRQLPTTSDIHSLDAEYEISLISPNPRRSDSVRKLATDIALLRKYIFENYQYNCIIINTDIISEPAGPFYTDSGRMVYRFNFRVETTPEVIYG